MAHRTTNPLTSMYGDGRETATNRYNWPGKKKLTEAREVWSNAFPDEVWPTFASTAYARLAEAGYVWSTRRGWTLRE